MKNKLLLLFIILILISGCGKESEEDLTEKKKVDLRNLYTEFIKEEKYKDDYGNYGQMEGYTFKDITGNGVEELIIEGSYSNSNIRTLVYSYDEEENRIFIGLTITSTSGLMINEEDNTLLYITRGSPLNISYKYLKYTNTENSSIFVKDVYYKISTEKMFVRTSNGEDEMTQLEARTESEKYKYIGMTYSSDGKQIEETKRDIFEDYPLDGFDINGKKLNYGLYKAQKGINLEITLYLDGTCLYNGVSNKKSSSKYKVNCRYEKTKVNSYGKEEDGILFHLDAGGDEEFSVTINNNMFSSWIDLNFVR